MNYLKGNTLKELREKKNLTQTQLAEVLSVSSKAISKWENDRGMPDISIFPELAAALDVSVPELMTDTVIKNSNRTANMQKMHLYICPVCGNVIQSIGEGAFSCHGILLPEAEAENSEELDINDDQSHGIYVERVENEYHIIVNHEMKKDHYISFISYVTTDGLQMKKFYPEQNAECNFTICGHGIIYVYCNRHGLYSKRV